MTDTATAPGTPITLATDLYPFALIGPSPAQAPLLWNWSYTATAIAAAGTFLTSSTQDAAGYYQISGITGARNGEAIIALEPAGDAIPGNPGYPVDNLIDASGQLTANGFGYETADTNYANPYYANYLKPPIDEEFYSQTTPPGSSEGPIAFEAKVVPGVTIATVTPTSASGTLHLVVIHAPVSGTVSLDGTAVQYLPAPADPTTQVTFSFEVQGPSGTTTPVVTVIAGGNGAHSVTGASSGYTDVSFGDGNNAILLSGTENTVHLGNGNQLITAGGGGSTIYTGNGNDIFYLGGGGNTLVAGEGNDLIGLAGSGSSLTLGNGNDTVFGGTADTIDLANTTLSLFGTSPIVFIGTGNATVNDFATGLDLKIGPTAGADVLSQFARDPGGVVDLIGGIGGFTSAKAVLAALKSDGHGGTLLSFGPASALDFTGLPAPQLHAANFRIG